MADNPFGLSFAPLLANAPQGGSYQPSGGSTPQEAVQLLSLHRPTVYGAQAPAPAALLNSPGSAVSGLQALLDALRRAVPPPQGGLPPQNGNPTGPPPGSGGGGAPAQGPLPPMSGLPPSFTYPSPRPPVPSLPPQPPIGMPRGPNPY